MTNSAFDFDYDVIDGSDEPIKELYPIAQWHNGNEALEELGGFKYRGGFGVKKEYLLGDEAITGWDLIDLKYRNGKTEKTFVSSDVMLSVIRTRFRFFTKHGDEYKYYPRTAYIPGSTMRGNLHCLCAVDGLQGMAMATFTGKGSQQFERWLNVIDDAISIVNRVNAKKNDGKRLPRFAFWLNVKPGKHQVFGETGKQSTVTPPVIAMPDAVYNYLFTNAQYQKRYPIVELVGTREIGTVDNVIEFMRQQYVMRDNLVKFQDWYNVTKPWQDEWAAWNVIDKNIAAQPQSDGIEVPF